MAKRIRPEIAEFMLAMERIAGVKFIDHETGERLLDGSDNGIKQD